MSKYLKNLIKEVLVVSISDIINQVGDGVREHLHAKRVVANPILKETYLSPMGFPEQFSGEPLENEIKKE